MKYIDADRLQTVIKNLEEEARKIRVAKEFTMNERIGADGQVKLCQKLQLLIGQLPQEQPDSEEKFRSLLDAMGDCGFSQDDILLMKSIWEDAYDADKKAVKEIVRTVHKEVTRQVKEMVGKQPVEGLGDEAESYWIEAGWSKVMTLGRFKTIARHFAEWGAEHLKQ